MTKQEENSNIYINENPDPRAKIYEKIHAYVCVSACISLLQSPYIYIYSQDLKNVVQSEYQHMFTAYRMCDLERNKLISKEQCSCIRQ